ncbi:MAG: hypothetical protein AB7N91_32330 [Candidatus Tectimicrobiota bacterium]
MRREHPSRSALVVNRLFIQAFLAAEPPCLALGLVEERQQPCGMLALRLDEAMPPAVADRGFEFGHALYGSAAFVVRHLVCVFPGFQTYNVLLNPNNVVVQAVLRTMLDDGDYFFFALQPQGQVTAFRANMGHDDLAVLRANRARLQASTTTGAQYQQAVAAFAAHPDPPGILLQWVCRDQIAAVDLTANRMTLTPA